MQGLSYTSRGPASHQGSRTYLSFSLFNLSRLSHPVASLAFFVYSMIGTGLFVFCTLCHQTVRDVYGSAEPSTLDVAIGALKVPISECRRLEDELLQLFSTEQYMRLALSRQSQTCSTTGTKTNVHVVWRARVRGSSSLTSVLSCLSYMSEALKLVSVYHNLIFPTCCTRRDMACMHACTRRPLWA